MDRILNILRSADSADLLDIFVISAIFYSIFSLLRESRSFTALRGLVAIILAGGAIWGFAQLFNLTATTRLLEISLVLVVLTFVVLFQNELKKALTDFGQASIFRPFLATSRVEVEEIIRAVTRMSEKKIGALIAIERRNSLKYYIDAGTPLDAMISADLIRTIFALGTPLHDGAVIISNNRLAAAGALLPNSENPRLPKDIGTRHRAGIGLTEQTDAVAIICSEETGIISIAHGGRLDRNETQDSLRSKLRQLVDFEEEAGSG